MTVLAALLRDFRPIKIQFTQFHSNARRPRHWVMGAPNFCQVMCAFIPRPVFWCKTCFTSVLFYVFGVLSEVLTYVPYGVCFTWFVICSFPQFIDVIFYCCTHQCVIYSKVFSIFQSFYFRRFQLSNKRPKELLIEYVTGFIYAFLISYIKRMSNLYFLVGNCMNTVIN